MVEATLFIPLLIVGITQLIKQASLKVHGWVTVVVAFGVGIVVSLVDTLIGISDISIAQGLVLALGAIGISAVAAKAGGGAAGDESRVK